MLGLPKQCCKWAHFDGTELQSIRLSSCHMTLGLGATMLMILIATISAALSALHLSHGFSCWMSWDSVWPATVKKLFCLKMLQTINIHIKRPTQWENICFSTLQTFYCAKWLEKKREFLNENAMQTIQHAIVTQTLSCHRTNAMQSQLFAWICHGTHYGAAFDCVCRGMISVIHFFAPSRIVYTRGLLFGPGENVIHFTVYIVALGTMLIAARLVHANGTLFTCRNVFHVRFPLNQATAICFMRCRICAL